MINIEKIEKLRIKKKNHFIGKKNKDDLLKIKSKNIKL